MLIVFYLICVTATLPEYLAGRYTRLLLSYNPEIGVYYNELTGYLATKKLEKFDLSEIRLNKEGDNFILRVKEKFICMKDSKVQTCEEPSVFAFEALPFGYRIVYDDQCITAGIVLALGSCSIKNKLQAFVFDLSIALNCKEAANVYEEEKKEFLTDKEAKEIIKKGLAEKKITDSETMSLLTKLFNARKKGWGWKWPKFNWC